jgi:hypothetical protein
MCLILGPISVIVTVSKTTAVMGIAALKCSAPYFKGAKKNVKPQF